MKLDSRSVCVMQKTPPQFSPVMHQGLEQILQHRMGWIKGDALLKKGGTHMGQGSWRSEKSGSPPASHEPLERRARARALLWGSWVYSDRRGEPKPCPPRAHILVAEDVMENLMAVIPQRKKA